MREFYAYLWKREDGSPYYAGKGTSNRAFKGSSHNVKIPKDVSRIQLIPAISEDEAFGLEIRLISLFGRKDKGTGCLRNMTDGGEGVSGHSHIVTEETRKKMSLAQVGNKKTLGFRPNEETRKKLSEIAKKRTYSEETRRKISEAKKGCTPWNKGKAGLQTAWNKGLKKVA